MLSHHPVFVVGAPRSGTSILTWCLGQHPNLLGLEESNWMAPFAVDLAVAFRRGSARGERSQFSSMGVGRDQFMQEIGERVNASILAHREIFENRRVRSASADSSEHHPAFTISRNPSDPKSRWVNGTPEYSLGLAELRKVFPNARFIHIVRDCDLVVPSMLHFDRVSGCKLAESEEEGYSSWLRYVHACVMAESAYGARVVRRVFLQDLIDHPEQTLRGILNFLDEPFDPVCLEPLAKRINSSGTDSCRSPKDAAIASSKVISDARSYWRELRLGNYRPSQEEAVAWMEAQFEERVNFIYSLQPEYAMAQQVHRCLQAEFDERSRWALELNHELALKDDRILATQRELDDRTKWALSLDQEIARKDARILALQEELEDRTAWAIRLRTELEQMQAAGRTVSAPQIDKTADFEPG